MEIENVSPQNQQTDSKDNSHKNLLDIIKDFQLMITLLPVLLTALVYFLGFLYVQGSMSAFTLTFFPWQINFNGIITTSTQMNFIAGVIYFSKLLLCLLVAILVYPVVIPPIIVIITIIFNIIEKLSLIIGEFLISPIFKFLAFIRRTIPNRVFKSISSLFF